MDLDAFVNAHQGEWQRLDQLVRQRRLTGAEADEVLDLYQRVATHLSVVRSAAPDPTLVAWLSSMLARARQRTAGTRSLSWHDAARFFTDTFPAQLYRTRWWWITTALINVVTAFVIGAWFLAHPQVESALLSPQEVKQLVNSDFANYYTEFAASDFAFRVWTNNVWVSALCIAFGILGVPVVYLLWQNILNVALSGAILTHHGRAGLFFGLILPHGILELTAVFVAAATGLRLFWSWIEPGPRTRSQSLAAEGRSAMSTALGLIVVLGVSGIIEAFVTPSGLPTWARIGIGVVAEIAFLTYVFTAGRWAARRGATGDVSARDAGDAAPVAA
ncbi:MAG TPA: stage II sporulation protein M [Segeticoccus sp.]|uniref:stage II sporulation protein M n=1 Tax=Segeticoccus sp. TaxID=2706531 RepID=UPI002D7EAACB|nr:stage II sporulation protein M [Segeticoccus sp.]HET8602191.1 stage II sporulation protein M [Segeticoccus sp.]